MRISNYSSRVFFGLRKWRRKGNPLLYFELLAVKRGVWRLSIGGNGGTRIIRGTRDQRHGSQMYWRQWFLSHSMSTTARGFLGCYRELREDWFQSIHRHGISLGTNLERKIFWCLRNRKVRTSILRSGREGWEVSSLTKTWIDQSKLGGTYAGTEHG